MATFGFKSRSHERRRVGAPAGVPGASTSLAALALFTLLGPLGPLASLASLASLAACTDGMTPSCGGNAGCGSDLFDASAGDATDADGRTPAPEAGDEAASPVEAEVDAEAGSPDAGEPDAVADAPADVAPEASVVDAATQG